MEFFAKTLRPLPIFVKNHALRCLPVFQVRLCELGNGNKAFKISKLAKLAIKIQNFSIECVS